MAACPSALSIATRCLCDGVVQKPKHRIHATGCNLGRGRISSNEDTLRVRGVNLGRVSPRNVFDPARGESPILAPLTLVDEETWR